MRGPGPTGGDAASAIEVDYFALRRVVATLRALAREMADRDGSLQAEVADPQLHEALRHAERDWWDQRRRLGSYFESSARSVEAALASYQRVDATIRRAATSPSGGDDVGRPH